MLELHAILSTDTPDGELGKKLYIGSASGMRVLRGVYHSDIDGPSSEDEARTIEGLDVPYSSGIVNHFFYILAEGTSLAEGHVSQSRAASVGIGRSDATNIWYRALTVYMTSRTDCSEARAATIAAAADLFGAESTQVEAVANAWNVLSVF